MDAGPDGVRASAVEEAPPLGAAVGGESLGPISPELALVDPELAERARRLLPEPRERPRPRRPAPARAPAVAPEPAEVPAPQRKRRWARTAVLAALVFAAGAASGGFFGERHAGSPEATLGLPAGPTATSTGVTQTTTQQQSTGERTASSTASRSSRPSTTPAKKKKRPSAPVTWAANVLGVEARVDGPRVELVWQRPPGSDHVVVVRAVGTRKRGKVVFHGDATSYRDGSPRPCTAYRYTIVNYDRRGDRSTGVPTAVVTRGCT
jgi:hypothetical protein